MDGWDEDKQALRTFSADRMTSVNVLPESATECTEQEMDALLTPGYGLFAGADVTEARLVLYAGACAAGWPTKVGIPASVAGSALMEVTS